MNDYINKMFQSLKIDCEKCFGLCCIALCFSTAEGFPTNKEAGKPCIHLQNNFNCRIHNKLLEKGMKGCLSFDCFGAGQKMAQVTYDGNDWINFPESSKKMFEVFSVMRQLHEMLWYLTGALLVKENSKCKDNMIKLIDEIADLTYLGEDSLLSLDIVSYRYRVNEFLKKTFESVQNNYFGNQKHTLCYKKSIGGRLDLMGIDLRETNLAGADLRGAFLIAADLRGCNLSGTNLIGADLRDTDVRGTDFRESLFITQSQINSAKGNLETKLPQWIDYPESYKN